MTRPQMVKLFNDNTYPLSEMFKGEPVTIEPKDYWRDKKGKVKILDLFEANDFRGQYHPIPLDGSGRMTNDPRNFKMIRMEVVDPDAPVVEETDLLRCMAQGCKHISSSQEEFEAHAGNAHPSVERLVLPEQDVEIKKKTAKK